MTTIHESTWEEARAIFRSLPKEADAITAIAHALHRARQEAAEKGWQPIETAPKDGSGIILGAEDWSGAGFWSAGEECRRAEAGWFFEDDRDRLLIARNCHPTHWRQFPEPPTAEASHD